MKTTQKFIVQDLDFASIPVNFFVIVECMTFNHHFFIEETMNGFCIQKTDFPYLCIVMDDCSTDGEQKVIEKYLHDYFRIFDIKETDDYVLKICRHETNENCWFAVFYLKYNHWVAGKSKYPYYSYWLKNCKYIALCEGDDYWIDKEKLQMQVDVLEQNPRCTCCGHGFLTHFQNSNDEKDFTIYDSGKDFFLFTSESRENKWVLKTLTCLYRRNVFEECINRHYQYGKDYNFQWHALKNGDGIYIPKPMGIYNVHDGGVWSSISEKERAKGSYNTSKELYLKNERSIDIEKMYLGAIRKLMCYEKNLKIKKSLLMEYMSLPSSFKQKLKCLILFFYTSIFICKDSRPGGYLRGKK